MFCRLWIYKTHSWCVSISQSSSASGGVSAVGQMPLNRTNKPTNVFYSPNCRIKCLCLCRKGFEAQLTVTGVLHSHCRLQVKARPSEICVLRFFLVAIIFLTGRQIWYTVDIQRAPVRTVINWQAEAMRWLSFLVARWFSGRELDVFSVQLTVWKHPGCFFNSDPSLSQRMVSSAKYWCLSVGTSICATS